MAYDFTNRALRYDVTYLSGPLVPFTTLMNFTSLCLNDTLYMITWEAYLDKTPNCVACVCRSPRARCLPPPRLLPPPHTLTPCLPAASIWGLA